ncbi:plasmid pRiA4b ORF-3-like family protein [Xenorhabdus beddingii]|uniref:Plasmid pRiA4b ORF-3-like family protein n=1 Tax=Xenorhabdus beddingii TaxID=40578 RepID=A0A1Y2SSE4_9GAMM|nr:plasmid pRiA4b ORF-3 family protein [Xenorhabdus beddingii]OTA21965.1 plasmid pRiA4b ORF-3-like family protein [Xenorhabdus beddingii]
MEKFYLLKITLTEMSPCIWRRFVVPSHISLDRLHDVIQIVMGWNDSHLHQFAFGIKRFTEMPEEPEDGKEEGKVKLDALLKRKGSKFTYLYDFGDGWEHEIILENSHYSPEELPTPIFCVEGQRACPPENCGGIYSYMELIDILKAPSHKDYQAMFKWVNGKSDISSDKIFSPEKFNIEEVNNMLASYYRWSRDRYLSLF